nr:traI domain protein [Escherichia coli]
MVVRIAGEGRPWESRCHHRWSRVGGYPDSSVQPGAGNGEPVTAEVLAQRQAEEAIRRETERRADEIVRKMAENKPDLPDGKTELAVRDIAGRNVTGLPVLNGKPHCRRVCCVNHNGTGSGPEVARENLLQEVCSRWSGIWFVTAERETLGGD